MLKLKILAAPAALLLTIIASPMAAAADGDAGVTEVCTTGKRAVYRHVGHPSKSMQLPRRQYIETKRCSTQSRTALVLASYLDAPGGSALVAGRAERALREINRNASTSTHELINMCAANTALHQWTEAQEACDAAVNAATLRRSTTHARPEAARRAADEAVAVAYSNRAVMRWLSNDTGAALGDLSKARSIAPKAAFVVRNVELTVRVPAQLHSQTDAAPVG